MKDDVFPWLGKRPVIEIDAPEVLDVLKRIDGRGVRYCAHMVRAEISIVFRYGIRQGVCKFDPAQALIGVIPRHVTQNFAAITDPASGRAIGGIR